MVRHRWAALVFLLPLAAGCTGVSRDNAKSLGQAGQATAQAVLDQDNSAVSKLKSLPSWTPVRETLNCAVLSTALQPDCLSEAGKMQMDPGLLKSWSTLVTLMQKRADAAQALQKAYTAYLELATYDAGTETKTAIQTAASSVETLTQTLTTFFPAASVAAPVEKEVASLLGDAAGFIASERQTALLLQASKALHTVAAAFAKDLAVERDYAAPQLMGRLQDETLNTYQAFVASEVVSPTQVLAPLLQSVAPGAVVSASAPAANAKIVKAAALAYMMANSKDQAKNAADSYGKAIVALQKLADQHAKFEAGAAIDTADVLAVVQSLANDLPKPAAK